MMAIEEWGQIRVIHGPVTVKRETLMVIETRARKGFTVSLEQLKEAR